MGRFYRYQIQNPFQILNPWLLVYLLLSHLSLKEAPYKILVIQISRDGLVGMESITWLICVFIIGSNEIRIVRGAGLHSTKSNILPSVSRLLDGLKDPDESVDEDMHNYMAGMSSILLRHKSYARF